MIKSLFSLCFSLFFSVATIAQHEGDNWVMGWGAGLRFLPDGSFSFFSGQQHTREGVASISDPVTGDLLFYTDGTTVWNRQHSVMLHGQDLLGNYSAAQSAVIIPKPETPGRYYIFTAPQLNQDVPYCASEVDMALDNGLGGIVPATKNTHIGDQATEKITTALHCNGRDFWLIMRHSGGNRFTVRLIDKNGIHAPQSYSLGAYVANDTWNEANYLKLSRDQSLLVHPIGPVDVNGGGVVELFHFDNSTGAITGPYLTLDGFAYPYAAEFSADNRLLYVSDIFSPSKVHQFDLSLGSKPAVMASQTELVQSGRYSYGALQIGPDNKMYVAKEDGYDNGSNTLDVIQSPSTPGTGCQYLEDGLTLGTGSSLIGLPNIPTYVYAKAPKIAVAEDCASRNFQFSILPADLASATVAWDFGDPASGVANKAVSPSAAHQFSQTGQYTVTAIVSSACRIDTFYLPVDVQALFPATDTFFTCPGKPLVLSSPSANTVWNGSFIGAQFTANQPGQISYQYTDAYNCIVQASAVVEPLPPVTTTEQMPLCAGDTIVVWGNPVVQPGSYSATLTSASGCDSIHTVQVYLVYDTIYIFENQHICAGDTLMWQGNALSAPGVYAHTDAQPGTCVRQYELSLSLRALPTVEAAVVPAGCSEPPAGSIALKNFIPGAQARLDTGDWQPAGTFAGLGAGRYTVALRDPFGCMQDAQFILPEPPPMVLDLQVDSTLLECGVVGLHAAVFPPRPVRYAWLPAGGLDCSICPDVMARLAEATTFSVTATDSMQCSATASVSVPYALAYHIYAPNVFSPNDDGVNDRFTLYSGPCVKLIRYLSVFDRWGGLAFHRKDLSPGDENQGWDGFWRNQNLVPGVFAWVAEVELVDGQVRVLSGSVTVVR